MKEGICVNQSTAPTPPRVETYVQAKARESRELYLAFIAQGFTEDQAIDLVGATLIGRADG